MFLFKICGQSGHYALSLLIMRVYPVRLGRTQKRTADIKKTFCKLKISCIFAYMKTRIVDITRLKTIAGYAKLKGLTTARIYQLIGEGELRVVKIDGKKFIHI